MAIARVKSAKGSSALATVPWAFGSATTSGNLIVGIIYGDDYNSAPTSGWNESSEMRQSGFHGAYLWWRISTGETTPQAYTIGSASNSAWMLLEYSGVHATPYDISQGLLVNTSGSTYATDSITPSSGGRLLLAAIGGSLNVDLSASTVATWTNSFTGIDSSGSGGAGTNDLFGAAELIVTANGSTAYSTGADFETDLTLQSTSALIISFKASGASQSNAPRAMHHYRQRR